MSRRYVLALTPRQADEVFAAIDERLTILWEQDGSDSKGTDNPSPQTRRQIAVLTRVFDALRDEHGCR